MINKIKQVLFITIAICTTFMSHAKRVVVGQSYCFSKTIDNYTHQIKIDEFAPKSIQGIYTRTNGEAVEQMGLSMQRNKNSFTYTWANPPATIANKYKFAYGKWVMAKDKKGNMFLKVPVVIGKTKKGTAIIKVYNFTMCKETEQ